MPEAFLKNYLARTVGKTIFSPEVHSIESFVENISGLTTANNTQLLFELYSTYILHAKSEKDNFYTFSKWGQMLLQDFNEVDRYLVAPEKIFTYLSQIQELNHWYLKADRTQMMTDYIEFWKTLPDLYENFTKSLLALGLGHQGLIYRRATENLHDYLSEAQGKEHIFIGFNALNASESRIIQEILSTTDSSIYWDIDPYFLEDNIHDAGYFHKAT